MVYSCVWYIVYGGGMGVAEGEFVPSLVGGQTYLRPEGREAPGSA